MHVIVEETGSTNADLLAAAAAGAADRSVLWRGTRPPGGDGSTGGGTRRPAPTCWCRCCSATCRSILTN